MQNALLQQVGPFGFVYHQMTCFLFCSDDLAYAHTLIGNYQDPPNSSPEMALPIHLARISCAPDAASLNDCLHGVVWGDVRGCTHELDVGVVCGPELVAPKMREFFVPTGRICSVSF